MSLAAGPTRQMSSVTEGFSSSQNALERTFKDAELVVVSSRFRKIRNQLPAFVRNGVAKLLTKSIGIKQGGTKFLQKFRKRLLRRAQELANTRNRIHCSDLESIQHFTYFGA